VKSAKATLPEVGEEIFPGTVTLYISGTVKGVKHRQFLIDRVLAYSWVRGERDLQDTWVESYDAKEGVASESLKVRKAEEKNTP
jgi:hypothetical protein